MKFTTELICQLKHICLDAGMVILTEQQKLTGHKFKADGSEVTTADIAAGKYIIQKLKYLSEPELAKAPVICEDGGSDDKLGSTEIFWLVDPIDGTKNFIQGSTQYTVNIALIVKQQPVLGFIYLPATQELYFTNEDLQVIYEKSGLQLLLPPASKKIAVVSANHFNQQTQLFLDQLKLDEVKHVASSIKLCLIAANQASIYPKFGQTMEWDTAAGHALINAAGGQLLEYHTKQPLLYGKPNYVNPDFLALAANNDYLSK